MSTVVGLVVIWGQTLLAVGLAAAAHELAHVLAATVLGVRIESVGLSHVHYRLPSDAWLRDRVISLAPQLSGLLGGAGWLIVNGLPTGLDGLPVAAGWCVLTLNGGVDDFRFVTEIPQIDRERWWQWARWTTVRPAEQSALVLFGVAVVSLALAGLSGSRAVVQLALGAPVVAFGYATAAVAGREVADWEAQIGQSRRAVPDGGAAASNETDTQSDADADADT